MKQWLQIKKGDEIQHKLMFTGKNNPNLIHEAMCYNSSSTT